jgi:predicted nuclease of predicted toxin-antitoxin system
MKFLADMGISPRTVAKLRREGYDAVHLIEEGLEKLEDRGILTKARNEARIILTFDYCSIKTKPAQLRGWGCSSMTVNIAWRSA